MSKRFFTSLLALVMIVAFGYQDLQAQVHVAAEGRAGVTFPIGDLSDLGAEAGLALGAELMLTFQRNLTAYVGVQRHGFSCDADCELGGSLASTGLGAGLKYIFPSPPDALIWGRAGLLAHELSGNDFSGSRNLGFEGSAGVDMPVGQQVYLVPHIGFLTHDAGGNVRATWVNFGVGLHYHF